MDNKISILSKFENVISGFALPVANGAKCEEKNYFGTRIMTLAKTSGEKKNHIENDICS